MTKAFWSYSIVLVFVLILLLSLDVYCCTIVLHCLCFNDISLLLSTLCSMGCLEMCYINKLDLVTVRTV